MSKVELQAAEAINQLSLLVAKFTELNTTVKNASAASVASLSSLEKKLIGINGVSQQTSQLINQLTASLNANTGASNKNSNSKKKNTTQLVNSVAALEDHIKRLRDQQKRIANTNKAYLLYELRIKDTQEKIKKLTATSSKFHHSLGREKIALMKAGKAQQSYSKKVSATGGFLAALTRYLGVYAAANFLKQITVEVFNMTKSFDGLQYAMEKITGTTLDMASSERFLLEITREYGVELLNTSQRYLKFLAAARQSNLSLNDTEKIFKSVTKAGSVLSLKTHELSGVYLALEQMLSKGKVTTEELRRQLGERLPGAMGIMAAALKVTIPQLDEMLKKGEVLSSVALPKFAKAVEAAYGIQSVGKINNMVAAQTRLNNVWQEFIKDIGRDDGVLKKFFVGFLSNLEQTIGLIAKIFASPGATLQNEIIEQTRVVETKLKFATDVILKQNGIFVKNYEAQLLDARNALLDMEGGTDAYKAQEQVISNLIAANVDQIEEIEKARKTVAKEEFADALKLYKQEKLLYDEKLKQIKEIKAKQDELSGGTGLYSGAAARTPGVILDNVTGEAKRQRNPATLFRENETALGKYRVELAELVKSYGAATAAYDKYRKILQESALNKPEDNKKNRGKIDTSDIDLLIANLKAQIEGFKSYIDDPVNIVENRIAALTPLFSAESDLIKAQMQKKIRLAEKHKTKEQIASVEHQAELFKIIYNAEKRKSSLQAKFFADGQTTIIQQYLKQLNDGKAEIKKRYGELSKLTTKELKKYNKEIKDLEVENNNESINKQIDFIRKWMAELKVFGDDKVALEAKIQELISKLKENYNEKDTRTEAEIYQSKLDQAREFLSGLGDLYEAFSDRRIEAIEAEINAEERKYDKLIELAENDASRKEALEKEKQIKLAILEKKRLQEERKAAIARKVFALGEIAINTAIAISKVTANRAGWLGIPEITWLKIQAGMQAAAVLAAPIPQYKDGLENANEDHIGMINDGGQKEYIKRDGKILSTDTKNAIVQLKKGDTVYKNKDEMLAKYINYNALFGGGNLKEYDLNVLSSTIKNSIDSGFKKAKINNSINLTNRISNGSYLMQKSRFNG